MSIWVNLGQYQTLWENRKGGQESAEEGPNPGAVEKAVSQGMANGAKKKPVGRAGAGMEGQDTKTA